MKKDAILILLCGWVALTSLCFVSCGNDDNPQRINLIEMPREYSAEKGNLKLTINGEAVNASKAKIAPRGGHPLVTSELDMWLNLELWGDNKCEYKVHTIAYEDYVEFEYEIPSADRVYYDINSYLIKGLIKDGIMNLEITYTVKWKQETGQKFVYLLSEDNLSVLGSGGPYEVVWNGQTIRWKDFIIDAAKPILQKMRETIDGKYFCVCLNDDNTMTLSSMPAINGKPKMLPGSYKLLFPDPYSANYSDALLVADEEGAKFLSKMFWYRDEIYENGVYDHCNGKFIYRIAFEDYRSDGGMQMKLMCAESGLYSSKVGFWGDWHAPLTAEGLNDEAERAKTCAENWGFLEMTLKRSPLPKF